MQICLITQSTFQNSLSKNIEFDKDFVNLFLILLFDVILLFRKQADNNYDVVTGTRYAHGGGVS